MDKLNTAFRVAVIAIAVISITYGFVRVISFAQQSFGTQAIQTNILQQHEARLQAIENFLNQAVQSQR